MQKATFATSGRVEDTAERLSDPEAATFEDLPAAADKLLTEMRAADS